MESRESHRGEQSAEGCSHHVRRFVYLSIAVSSSLKLDSPALRPVSVRPVSAGNSELGDPSDVSCWKASRLGGLAHGQVIHCRCMQAICHRILEKVQEGEKERLGSMPLFCTWWIFPVSAGYCLDLAYIPAS